MNHERESQRPCEDARPYLPTEIEPPYPPTKIEPPYPPPAGRALTCPRKSSRPTLRLLGARPFLPTEIEPPYPPATHAGSRLPGDAHRARRARGGQARPTPRATPGWRWTSRPGPGGPIRRPQLRGYGPGVPATPPTGAAHTAERIWVTGRPDQPPRRPRRWRGLACAALTVILLAASAVLLFLRFHHAPFDVTGVKITQRTQSGCGVTRDRPDQHQRRRRDGVLPVAVPAGPAGAAAAEPVGRLPGITRCT